MKRQCTFTVKRPSIDECEAVTLFALVHQSCGSAVRYANTSRSLQLQYGLDSAFGYPPINRLYANSKHLSNVSTGVEFQLGVVSHVGVCDAISHNPSRVSVLCHITSSCVSQNRLQCKTAAPTVELVELRRVRANAAKKNRAKQCQRASRAGQL